MAGPKYVKDFEFPREAGFTGSANVPVRGYQRRFAKGGSVSKEEVRDIARQEVRRHVRAKPPAGHGVKSKRVGRKKS